MEKKNQTFSHQTRISSWQIHSWHETEDIFQIVVLLTAAFTIMADPANGVSCFGMFANEMKVVFPSRKNAPFIGPE